MENSNIQNIIHQYTHHPAVINLYKKFKLIDTDTDYPSMIYFGINFCEDEIISFKVYFAINKKLKDEEIQQLLPTITDFKKYYHFWQESKIRNEEHTGCTFEIKFKQSLQPTFGFHYRLNPTDEAYELIGLPQMLNFNIKDEGTRPGINYEYEPDKTLRKKYYYIKNQNHKKIIANRFMNDYVNNAIFIEYTESTHFSKINIWNPNYTKINLERTSIFSKKEQEIIGYFKTKYGLINISDGIYEEKNIKATYFFNLEGNAEFPFEDPKNFKIDTLKLFYS